MDYLQVRKKLICVFENNGILVDESVKDSNNDFLVSEFIVDSIQWISIIANVEDEFEIEWPDELLSISYDLTLNSLTNLLCEQKKEQCDNV